MHGILVKRAAKPREYSNREIKSMRDIFNNMDISQAEKRLFKDPSLVFIKDPEDCNNTLLHMLVKRNWTEGIDVIIKAGLGADYILNIENNSKLSPLMLAYQNNNIVLTKYLISKGSDLEVRDQKQRTILFNAVLKEDYELVKYLISSGANPNVTDISHYSALCKAISIKNINIVNLLISKGADPNATNDDEEIPLMCACKEGNIEIVKFLVSKNELLRRKEF